MPEFCYLQDAHLALPHNLTYTRLGAGPPVRWQEHYQLSILSLSKGVLRQAQHDCSALTGSA